MIVKVGKLEAQASRQEIAQNMLLWYSRLSTELHTATAENSR